MSGSSVNSHVYENILLNATLYMSSYICRDCVSSIISVYHVLDLTDIKKHASRMT